MPITIDDLNRSLIPRVLTPGTSVAELLALFVQTAKPYQSYAVVRVGLNAYDVLALADLVPAVEHYRDGVLALTLHEIPNLLYPVAPVIAEKVSLEAAIARRDATRRLRLVVLDQHDAVLGVLISATYLGTSPKGLDPLDLLAAPQVLQPGTQEVAYLHARFDGLAHMQPLIVEQRVVLIISVGPLSLGKTAQGSQIFRFTFADTMIPVAFKVYVDADPEMWTIKVIEPTLVVAPPGMTTQEAEFQVMARKPGRDKLHIGVERIDTGATIHHMWLPMQVELEKTLTLPMAAASEIIEVALPPDTNTTSRRRVEVTIQPGKETFRAVVRADLLHHSIRTTYSLPVGAAEIQNAALRLRQELRSIVYYSIQKDGSIFYPFANKQTLTVDETLARRVAVPLAEAGQQIWHMLFNNPRASEELKSFAADLRMLPLGSSVQIVLDSQRLILPWALLYDKPGPITPETLDWSGFWGYRYVLDVLPPGRYPAPEIRDTPLPILLLFNDDSNLLPFTYVQEEFVRENIMGVQLRSAWGNKAVREALTASNYATFVYCYCHGTHTSGAMRSAALSGDSALYFSGNQLLRLMDLRNLPIPRLVRQPLVFLNACEGAAQDSFYYDGFMPYFIEELGARGFIGTEVKAPQLLGHDFALNFIRRFVQGHTVGEILWTLRRHYLDMHHTILGFNYSLYCLADVRVIQPR